MARQRIHNRRAGRGSVSGGTSWISYSDMMAALLLIFVLILTYSLSHYFSMLESKDLLLRQTMHELGHTTQTLELKTRELDQKDRELTLKDQELQQTIIILDEKDRLLSDQETELNALRVTLDAREQELAVIQSNLILAQARLEEQQKALADQATRIDALIGIRKTMITDLSVTLSRAGLDAKVDENGNIVLNSSVLFESGKSTIRPEGKEFLQRFIPVYLGVLLQDEYADYLGEIIIEGHTDSVGTYESNLKLSQDRALQVALYCLELTESNPPLHQKLQQILTAKGRSESDLVMVNGIEDPDASRRVEFKFSLKDAQMIEEMNRILTQQDLGE